MQNKFYTSRKIQIQIFFLILFITSSALLAQVPATAKTYIRVGSLQSNFTAYGSVRAWTGGANPYYEGMIWPADYPQSDNAVIKRSWIAIDDFTDANGNNWEKYGLYFAADYVDQSLFPVKLEQTSKFKLPQLYVDGNNVNQNYTDDYDLVDPNLIADRKVVNEVNTTAGLTMRRTIYAFSQQYHDNYFIKEYVLKNTGNVDYDDDIELQQTLKGVYFSWGTRYSASREGAYAIGNGQSYGKHFVVTKRGETYAQNYTSAITENTPLSSLDWLRAVFGWAGQSETNSFDNIGAPKLSKGGRLASPQHVGTVTLHVDKTVNDSEDDPHQPFLTGWHAGDTYPSLGNMQNPTPMKELYTMLSGHPYKGLGGSNRFDETYITKLTYQKDPYTVHGDGGGTNMWVIYGPFDIPFGDSIVIVEAEGVNGLNRQLCETIGRRWKKAYLNSSDQGPFVLPDGSTTKDKDVYKNTWVFTGKDSIMETFSRAKRNYDSGMQIPQPPQPPQYFEVSSGGDKISLKWDPSPSEGNSDFGGYRIYRAVGKPDTTYKELFACGVNTAHSEIVHEYNDFSATRGFSYYYYLVAFNDGSNNTSGELNPPGELHSGRFYLQATDPAYLQRPAGDNLEGIRIVPNPYNISAKIYNYPGEPNKITFLNIPAYCTIKIYTERGDLVKEIEHSNGSGDASWNLVSSTRQTIVSGLYIAYFEVSKDYTDVASNKLLYKKGEKIYKKFVIVR